jgi:hypothetical protein
MHRSGARILRTRVRALHGGIAGRALLLLHAFLLLPLLLITLLLLAFLLFPLLLVTLLLLAFLLLPLLLVALLLLTFLLFPLLLITLLLLTFLLFPLLLITLLLLAFLLLPLLLLTLLLIVFLLLPLLLLLLLSGLPKPHLRRNHDQRKSKQKHDYLSAFGICMPDCTYREKNLLMRQTFRHSCRLGIDGSVFEKT